MTDRGRSDVIYFRAACHSWSMRDALFERYKSLHRQKLKIEAELETIERQIVGERDNEAAPQPKTKAKPKSPPKSQPKTKPGPEHLAEATKTIARKTITAMREIGAGKPVLRRDVAKSLGISDYAMSYRFRRLQAVGFVEKVGGTHWRVVDIVPEL